MRWKGGGRWGVLLLILMLAVASGCSSTDDPALVSKLPPLRVGLHGYKEREAELKMVAGYLNAVGVEVELKLDWKDKSALQVEARGGGLDLYAQDHGSSSSHPFDLLGRRLRPGTSDNPNPVNTSFYSNPEVAKLVEVGEKGQDDRNGGLAYEQIQAILTQDAPWIFGYELRSAEAYNSDVQGYDPANDGRIHLRRVSRKSGQKSLVVGMKSQVTTLDPTNFTGRDTETVIRQMYDGLVMRTPTGDIALELAEKYWSTDPMTHYFELRKDVLFHDGKTRLSAQDVEFTFNRVMGKIDGKDSSRKGLVGPIQEVEALGPHVVRFTLKHPFLPFLQLLPHIQIVSRAHVESLGGSSQKITENPNGTGPFKLRSRKEGEIVLERFATYYGGPATLEPGPAKLETVTFSFITNQNERVNALMDGRVDLIQQVPFATIPVLQQSPAYQTKSVPSTTLYFIEINNRRITDPKVRQALNYAINWDKVIQRVYGGEAARVPTAVLPGSLGYSKAIGPWPYNPRKAKELLREAGYWTPPLHSLSLDGYD